MIASFGEELDRANAAEEKLGEIDTLKKRVQELEEQVERLKERGGPRIVEITPASPPQQAETDPPLADSST